MSIVRVICTNCNYQMQKVDLEDGDTTTCYSCGEDFKITEKNIMPTK